MNDDTSIKLSIGKRKSRSASRQPKVRHFFLPKSISGKDPNDKKFPLRTESFQKKGMFTIKWKKGLKQLYLDESHSQDSGSGSNSPDLIEES